MQFCTSRIFFRRLQVVCLFFMITTGTALAQNGSSTAADLLKQGISQCEQGNYEQAKTTLDRIDPIQLETDQRAQLSSAIKMIGAAQKALTTYAAGAEAEQKGDLNQAMTLYKQVTAISDAPKNIRGDALEALARVESALKKAEKVEVVEAPKKEAPETVEPKEQPAEQPKEQPKEEPKEQPKAEPKKEQGPSPEDLIEQARKLQVQKLLADAEQAITKAQYPLAEESYTKALGLDPENATAKTGLEKVKAMVGRDTGGGLIDGYGREITLKAGQARARYGHAMDTAGKELNNGNYDEATDAVTLAKTILDSNKQFLPASELATKRSERLQLAKTINQTAEKVRLDEMKAQADQAKGEKIKAQATALREKQDKVQELLRRAVSLTKDQKFNEAIEQCEQVLFIDPNNVAAKYMRDMLKETLLMRQHIEINTQRDLAIMQTNIDSLKDSIPHSEIMMYPVDWPQLTERRLKMLQGGAEDSEMNIQVRKKLLRNIPVDFTANGFEQVVEYLRNVTGVDIVPNWRALVNAGIQKEQPVTLKLQSVPATKALNLILDDVGGELVKLGYTIEDGVVIIATKEFLSEKTVIRSYDIRDLVVSVPDFNNAPEFDLSTIASDPSSGGGGGGGQSIFDDSNDDDQDARIPRSELIVRIMELVRNTIAPDSWRSAGGLSSSMEELNGTLIVNTTSDNHQEINALLSQLREQRALQISMDARFLFVTQNFMEEVGIDVDIAWVGDSSFVQSPILIGNNTSTMAQAIETDIEGSFGQPQFPGLFAAGAGGGPITFMIDDLQVNLLVRATHRDRRTISVNTPRLTFFNGQRAYLTVSRQVTFISDLQPVGSGNSIAFDPEIDVVSDGVVLSVEGTISADRRYVTMTIEPSLANIISIDSFEIAFPGQGDDDDDDDDSTLPITGLIQFPTIQLTTVRTTVSVPDKGTIMLGGQRLQTEVEIEAGVPVLSKIPILNRFFTNRSTVKDERTLLILVKPTILIQSEHENRLFPGLMDNASTFNMNNQLR